MKAFEVFVDGRRLCTVGTGDAGMATANLHCFGASCDPGGAFLAVGGLDSSTGQSYEWPEVTLAIGSEVVIRLVETDAVDPQPEF